ncbi:hypothetical protein Ngar_c28680 [Candidatus Nitrososphaera gargensis Ga9.2]|uniref:Response regulatory domain-containing protein n=1 Tax=Nitrososphaera gargensis (strain Ga9.2) TaxID=1237085 RepID=K0ILY1_NITGG|nr:hypothetical protein Ngar_c28680 [Candidatus Nitrososphaera gargensis Ga9.2]
MILIAIPLPASLICWPALFQLNNFTIYTATSAEECLALYSDLKDNVDMILMDDAIAGNSRVEVIINIMRIKLDQRIMVVVEKDIVKAVAMRVGAGVVVMKPISPT